MRMPAIRADCPADDGADVDVISTSSRHRHHSWRWRQSLYRRRLLAAATGADTGGGTGWSILALNIIPKNSNRLMRPQEKRKR
jgi:hypothetical protein